MLTGAPGPEYPVDEEHFDQFCNDLAGRYRIERELGRGGMAIVYLAHDLKLDRPVALKVLRPEVAATVGSGRFLREIKITAQLQHPNILQLLDSGEAAGLPFYVMRHVEAGSVADRLQRELQLPVEQAVRITCEISDALAYAHQHGVVHRDIKPDNVMLESGHAMVADFGIGRALNVAAGEAITTTGIAHGTVGYMSPEQAAGVRQLDGRSDIYSLGCVLYQMLTGDRPFTGATPQAVMARQSSETIPSIRVVRETVTPELEQAIFKALAKVPADRFTTAQEFKETLERLDLVSARPARGRRRATIIAIMGAATVLLGGVALPYVIRDKMTSPPGTGTLDTARYAILPFDHDVTIAGSANEEQLLRDAFARWEGISVTDPFQVRDVMAQRDTGMLSRAEANRLARRLGAGRYVRAQLSRVGDSLRVMAVLYDASHGNRLADAAAKVSRDLTGADVVFSRLADELLFRGDGSPASQREMAVGTISLPARQEFGRGLRAIERWDLLAAESAFVAASTHDTDYAEAFLWLGLVRWWARGPPATWRSAAERATAGHAELSSRDKLLAEAPVRVGRGAIQPACGTLQRLAEQEQYDFAAWYSWATCLGQDRVVVRDAGSPSGWRFRSSYQQALKAYQRAFQLLPSIHRAFRAGAYESLRDLLRIGGNDLQPGHAAPPDTSRFWGYPMWAGDSLTFFVVPAAELVEGRRRVPSDAVAEAVRRQRELFHEIALAWVTAFPRSADAMYGLAVALELRADPRALDTLRRARTLAQDSAGYVTAAGGEAWLRVKLSIPNDLEGLQAAKALVDSLLLDLDPARTSDPVLLASLAALTGRAELAAALARQSSVARKWRVPTSLVAAAPPLLAYAAMGGPADSIAALERRVEQLIERALPAGERRLERLQWLAWPATIAFPTYRSPLIRDLSGGGDYLVDAQAAFLRGDTAEVIRTLSELRTVRQFIPPANLAIDALFPEAWLFASLGEPDLAVEWLDPLLDSLAETAPLAFADPMRAGSLARAMALRAQLGAAAGDRRDTARWANAIVALWRDADDFLQPLVEAMRQFARK